MPRRVRASESRNLAPHELRNSNCDAITAAMVNIIKRMRKLHQVSECSAIERLLH